MNKRGGLGRGLAALIPTGPPPAAAPAAAPAPAPAPSSAPEVGPAQDREAGTTSAPPNAAPTVTLVPDPPRTPPWVVLPGKIITMFDPIVAIWASTCALAPRPTETIVITAPTPMIIPSIVRADLIVFRARARPAIFKATSGFIGVLI